MRIPRRSILETCRLPVIVVLVYGLFFPNPGMWIDWIPAIVLETTSREKDEEGDFLEERLTREITGMMTMADGVKTPRAVHPRSFHSHFPIPIPPRGSTVTRRDGRLPLSDIPLRC